MAAPYAPGGARSNTFGGLSIVWTLECRRNAMV